jgi:hypothetical protein
MTEWKRLLTLFSPPLVGLESIDVAFVWDVWQALAQAGNSTDTPAGQDSHPHEDTPAGQDSHPHEDTQAAANSHTTDPLTGP